MKNDENVRIMVGSFVLTFIVLLLFIKPEEGHALSLAVGLVGVALLRSH